jgi:hypothetical protein
MLQSFRKLISKTPDLNEVQQNVFDTVQGLQGTDLFTRFEFENKTGLSDNVFTSLGNFKLEPGNYLIEVESGAQVAFSGAPTLATAALTLRYVNSSEDLFPLFSDGINQAFCQKIYKRSVQLTVTNTTIEFFGKIDVNGGTVTSRNLLFPSVTAFRRFL